MDSPVQRYKLKIAYRGTHYHGWQEQFGFVKSWKGEMPDATVPHSMTGPPTVQELMRRAVEAVVHHPVKLAGSSRTDSGVHAKGQIAHFDTPMIQIPPEGMRRAINSRLPGDILVRTLEPVPKTFDAIGSTIEKRYQYLIWNHFDRPPFFSEMVYHRYQPMSVEAMQAAATLLEGEHDFASFAKPGHGRASTVRTVHECSVHARGPRIVISVRGGGFLWNMVRIMAGTLMEVGVGRFAVDDIPKILAAKNRTTAGPTALAQGLYLQWIKFKDDAAPLAAATSDV